MSELQANVTVVRSLDAERAKRWHQRVARLSLQFSRLGFHLDPLYEDRLLVQRWGLCRVLDVEEAERLLRVIGRTR